MNDDTGNEIHFYESKPTLAMTLYQDEIRYYKIPEEDYLAVAAMAESAYPRVQSIQFIEHENGTDEVAVTITDSNTIMRMAVLMQLGEEAYHKYFLYTENENDYYLDEPYDHMDKIDLNTVEEIITIFTAPVSENEIKGLADKILSIMVTMRMFVF